MKLLKFTQPNGNDCYIDPAAIIALVPYPITNYVNDNVDGTNEVESVTIATSIRFPGGAMPVVESCDKIMMAMRRADYKVEVIRDET